eukprot:TRINITY_DN19112_c0_g1_i2.p1 TRINITY_DN19112_c0_g1~~TRINITY_DN19112_c0_g1_i2.p1  ORF type:complete len:503 (+),score=77.97 TRINITY_DN19112_c0_g1_i2:87-1595(+)
MGHQIMNLSCDLVHPQGIQPQGNLWLNPGDGDARQGGLGLLNKIEDQTLLQILDKVDALTLARLSICSKALYCFGNYEELWKAQVLDQFEGNFQFKGSWRQTYLHQTNRENSSKPPNFRVKGFYSDLLYKPFICAHLDIPEKWLQKDNIERRSNLTLKNFRENFEIPNKPVVITDEIPKWTAFKSWTWEYLTKKFENSTIHAGGYEIKFQNFLEYLQNQKDEMPLYMFDKDFSKKVPQLVADYETPEIFPDDFFEILGQDRPDNKWLIIGSDRSGSSFHIDPNQTSAWNACIRGKKKWIMFPPDVVPPGVHPNEDGSSVATPVSLVEWFIDFYDQIQDDNLNSVEFVVEGGELVFVPRGWWHMVLNLEDSICITQNYVSVVTLPHVLKYFKLGNENLISGCRPEVRKNIFERFLKALKQNYSNDNEILKIIQKFDCDMQKNDCVNTNGGQNGWVSDMNGYLGQNGAVKRKGLSELFVVQGQESQEIKKHKQTSFSFNFQQVQ